MNFAGDFSAADLRGSSQIGVWEKGRASRPTPRMTQISSYLSVKNPRSSAANPASRPKSLPVFRRVNERIRQITKIDLAAVQSL